jgi:hypothetical protein
MKPTVNALLSVAVTFGISMRVDGEDIVLEAQEEPPEAAVDAFKESKPLLVAFLTEGRF